MGIGEVIIADYWKDDTCFLAGTPGFPGCWNWPLNPCENTYKCMLGENSFYASGSQWGATLYGSLVKINEENSINWEYDAGPVGQNELDLWGVMSHELGHAMGFAHIELNCGDTAGGWATMCQDISDHRGKSGARTLTSHEKDDLKEEY